MCCGRSTRKPARRSGGSSSTRRNRAGSDAALRYDAWKVVFLEQRAHGIDVWEERFVELRLPKLFNLRMEPFERADHEAIGYPKWCAERLFVAVPAQAYVAKWLQSFKEFPPVQEVASWSIDKVMKQMTSGGPAGK